MPVDDAKLGAATAFGGGPWLRHHWLKWCAVFGFWCFFGFLSGLQSYIGTRSEGMQHSFIRVCVWQSLGWCFWGLLTPPILWLGHRFPFSRGRWARALLAHLTAFAVFSAVHLAFFTFITNVIRPFDVMTNERPFWDSFVGRLTYQSHLELLIYLATLGVGYALDYYDKYRERESRASQLEAQLARAQLQAL